MSTSKEIWDKEIPVPASTILSVDPGLVNKLPEGSEVVAISPSGASYWARTAKIETVNSAGEDEFFFVKVLQGDQGKKMVSAEFHSMSKLYEVMPEIVARPIAWGEYESMPDTYFFLCEYFELSQDIPDASDFVAMIAELHKRPKGVAPDGKFGFDVITWGGRNPVSFPQSDTWEECFSKSMEKAFEAEIETQGSDQELSKIEEGLLEKVIPRLIRPMETEGRKLTPRLCHGDLWDGNASVDVSTGNPKIFDATPVYAHQEYDLAPWWVPRHRMTKAYVNEYSKHFAVSEPAEDFADRGLLYSIHFDLHASSLYPGNLRFRKVAMENMSYLFNKYSEGYEGYVKSKIGVRDVSADASTESNAMDVGAGGVAVSV